MCTPSIRSNAHTYGQKLYEHEYFEQWFKSFNDDQKRSANLIWERVFDKCGTDPDLPAITHVIDYGCGEGTFLKYLVEAEQRSAKKKGFPINFQGIDCCGKAIEIARTKISLANLSVCDPCPEKALSAIKVPWESTALIVMGHTWFHLDQKCLINTILERRPALILLDVYSSWDTVVEQLRTTQAPVLEHARLFPDGTTYWLKSKIEEDKVKRGIYSRTLDGHGKWEFETFQHLVTANELFGGLHKAPDRKNACEILNLARTNGVFVEEHSSGGKRRAYLHDRQYAHQTGWGPMECHVLVSLDRTSRVLNQAWLETMSNLIHDVAIDDGERHTTAIRRMLSQFNDPTRYGGSTGFQNEMSGSREALIVLPFDPNATFVRILSLLGKNFDITNHPLLVEQPTRWQTQFPSANGVFQTCLAKSSSAQAFPTGWAHDYELTPVDQAIVELECDVLGLTRDGKWPGEDDPASYFMVPFYKGSLPLYCLALKFPQQFAPETTGFDVYQSSIESLHAAIQTQLTDEFVRLRIIRPWIEGCLSAVWPGEMAHSSVNDKLDRIEKCLFGTKVSAEAVINQPKYQLKDEIRQGGVLAKEWKSWILGLPSFPINKMAPVMEQNRRLWEIWREEKRIADHNASLRISLWFQDGEFFEDGLDGESAHDSFTCKVHLERLQRMFGTIGFSSNTNISKDDVWIESAVQYLRKGASTDGSSVRQYFGTATAKHFLFKWMLDRLLEIQTLKPSCPKKNDCPATDNQNCPRTVGPFAALKSVFCKTRANKGEQVRFSLHRLYHVIDAARFVKSENTASIDPESIDKLSYLPSPYNSKFWSLKDPTIIIGEFIHCLAGMGLLDNVKLEAATESVEPACAVINLKNNLNKRMGGNEADRLKFYAEELVKCGVPEFKYEETVTISIQFSIIPNEYITS